jgi:protein-S-isoprenylcysteine O-methyltransferase Ste14
VLKLLGHYYSHIVREVYDHKIIDSGPYKYIRHPAYAGTHIATIGNGGFSMRKSLSILRQKGAIAFDVESGWEKITADPRSIDKKWYGNPYRW